VLGLEFIERSVLGILQASGNIEPGAGNTDLFGHINTGRTAGPILCVQLIRFPDHLNLFKTLSKRLRVIWDGNQTNC
jgi:hypothetical protein